MRNREHARLLCQNLTNDSQNVIFFLISMHKCLCSTVLRNLPDGRRVLFVTIVFTTLKHYQLHVFTVRQIQRLEIGGNGCRLAILRCGVLLHPRTFESDNEISRRVCAFRVPPCPSLTDPGICYRTFLACRLVYQRLSACCGSMLCVRSVCSSRRPVPKNLSRAENKVSW